MAPLFILYNLKCTNSVFAENQIFIRLTSFGLLINIDYPLGIDMKNKLTFLNKGILLSGFFFF